MTCSCGVKTRISSAAPPCQIKCGEGAKLVHLSAIKTLLQRTSSTARNYSSVTRVPEGHCGYVSRPSTPISVVASHKPRVVSTQSRSSCICSHAYRTQIWPITGKCAAFVWSYIHLVDSVQRYHILAASSRHAYYQGYEWYIQTSLQSDFNISVVSKTNSTVDSLLSCSLRWLQNFRSWVH